MIIDNSGLLYRFKLEHKLGLGFAEVYDFTDISPFDGYLVYVYNQVGMEENKTYDIDAIRKTGIALGPIRLNKLPNTRGTNSWKFLSRVAKLMINDLPESKGLQGLLLDSNWDNYQEKWYISTNDPKTKRIYVDYEMVRNLETRILNANTGVVTKFTMKIILDDGKIVSDYYDLSELGTKNMFIQLINTYYPLTKTKAFLEELTSKQQ